MKRHVCFVARAAALGGVVVVLGTSVHAAECTQTSVGLVPLTELGAATYKGMSGGLYAGGQNNPPRLHADRGRMAAARIVPRLADGAPHHSGRVVLISIGMSNTSQQFATFRELVRRDGRLSRALVVVDGAQGGMTASDWANASGVPWGELERRLAAAGVTREQVQIVDRTGLIGRFDIDIEFTPPREQSIPEFGSPLTQAVVDQLGLRFEQREEPMEVLVIDRVKMPSLD